jgi:hypothetical protein
VTLGRVPTLLAWRSRYEELDPVRELDSMG